jgi:uncharacterized protein YbjT (DUF2867 family)
MPEQKIFITGATGLLGSHVARLLLKRGYQNIVAVRRTSSSMALLGEDAGRITWVPGDVTGRCNAGYRLGDP